MHDNSTLSEAHPAASRSEYWSDHIRRWQGSGLSKAEYCRQNHLPKHAFHYWFRKLRQAVQQEGPVVPLSFRVADLAPSQPAFVLKIDQRFQVAIQGDFDPPVLKKLIKTLENMA
jgi:hypothetical protein